MLDEESREVAEADAALTTKEALIKEPLVDEFVNRWFLKLRGPSLVLDFVEDALATVDAVRKDERERISNVTRVEVIDYRRDPARCYAEWGVRAELAYQDEGRTLKVFVRAAPAEGGTEG